MFAYLIASGISTGALYAMVAIGLVLVYRSTGHINFSHGELFMMGGLHRLYVLRHARHALLRLARHRGRRRVCVGGALRPHRVPASHQGPCPHHGPRDGGVLVPHQGSHGFFWGAREGGDYVAFPAAVDPAPIPLGGIMVFPQQLLVLGGAFFFVVVFTIFFRRTRWGKMMQATAENATAAFLSGSGSSGSTP